MNHIIFVSLLAIFLTLVGINKKITDMQGTVVPSISEAAYSRNSVEVIGVRDSSFDGSGSLRGYIIRMPNGNLMEVRREVILGAPAPSPMTRDWRPAQLNTATRNGEIILACESLPAGSL